MKNRTSIINRTNEALAGAWIKIRAMQVYIGQECRMEVVYMINQKVSGL